MNTTLWIEPIRENFRFHYVPKLYIGLKNVFYWCQIIGTVKNDFMVVCKDESKNLDDDFIEDDSCQVGFVAHPTIFISNSNTNTKETEIRALLKAAMNVSAIIFLHVFRPQLSPETQV